MTRQPGLPDNIIAVSSFPAVSAHLDTPFVHLNAVESADIDIGSRQNSIKRSRKLWWDREL